jgi:hypothetical protein
MATSLGQIDDTEEHHHQQRKEATAASLGQIDDAEEHLHQQRKEPTAREPMGRTSTVEGGGGEMPDARGRCSFGD